MKKLTTLLLVFIAYTTYGQIPEIFEETWHLRFLKLEGDSNYSPLGVISNINFETMALVIRHMQMVYKMVLLAKLLFLVTPLRLQIFQ